jgi:hypothetical protein
MTQLLRPLVAGVDVRAKGLQASARNCGPASTNCGPDLKNLALDLGLLCCDRLNGVVKFSCGNREASTADRAKDVVVDDAQCLPYFWY